MQAMRANALVRLQPQLQQLLVIAVMTQTLATKVLQKWGDNWWQERFLC